MSKKSENTNLATQLPATLNSRGEELPSPVSLVTVAHSRPVSLGQRIKRYTQLPTLQNDLLFDEVSEEDYVGDYDGPPMSKYEDRHAQILENVKKRKHKEAEDKKKADKEKEDAEREEFRKRVLQVKEAGSEPSKPKPGEA